MDRRSNFREPQSVRHGNRKFRDHVAGVFGHDRRPDNFVRSFFRVNFYEPFNVPFEDRSVDVFQRLNVGVDFDSGFFRVRRIHANVSDFR